MTLKKKAVSISSSAEAKNAFSGLTKGAYVRLRKNGKPNANGGNGHSLIVLSVTNTYITTYEANFDQICGVTTRTLTYNQIDNLYDQLFLAIQHNYPTSYTNYNATYHVASCTTSGCSGKRYQQHYASTPGPNAVCLACGYVGYISIGYNELPDITM